MVINEFIYIPNETWKNWKYSKIYLEKTDKVRMRYVVAISCKYIIINFFELNFFRQTIGIFKEKIILV